jgi:hypothetical protein
MAEHAKYLPSLVAPLIFSFNFLVERALVVFFVCEGKRMVEETEVGRLVVFLGRVKLTRTARRKDLTLPSI